MRVTERGRAEMMVLQAMDEGLLRTGLLALVGVSSGATVAGGIFALIVGLKIVPRFAEITHTAKHMMLYENCIVFGGILGNIVYVYQISLNAGLPGVLLFGLIGGIYVGAWAMALAEIVDTFPIFGRRIGLKQGFGLLIILMALGRTVGGLIHFYYGWGT